LSVPHKKSTVSSLFSGVDSDCAEEVVALVDIVGVTLAALWFRSLSLSAA
jgi:hypothetical protein